jgi:hypothetical protein
MQKLRDRATESTRDGVDGVLCMLWAEEPNAAHLLIVSLFLLLLGALPAWPYSTGWGYYPSGGLGLILLIVIILVLAGRL